MLILEVKSRGIGGYGVDNALSIFNGMQCSSSSFDHNTPHREQTNHNISPMWFANIIKAIHSVNGFSTSSFHRGKLYRLFTFLKVFYI